MWAPKVEIEFLTDDPALREICERYWELNEAGSFRHRVADLAGQLGARPHEVPRKIASLCIARSTRARCSGCGIGEVVASRSAAEASGRWAWRCDTCNAAARAAATHAQAEAAKAQAEARLAQEERDRGRRAILVEKYDPRGRPPADVYKIDLRAALVTLALIKMGPSDDMQWLRPLSQLDSLSPGGALDIAWIRLAHAQGVIVPHPGSPLEAFAWEGDDPSTFYLDEVFWLAAGTSLGDLRDGLIDRLESEVTDRSTWPEIVLVKREISRAEVAEFFGSALAEHGLALGASEKLLKTIDDALPRFSVGQVCSLCWRAAKDAAAFQKRSNASDAHAANYAVKVFESLVAKALAEGWDPHQMYRDARFPQSIISEIFSLRVFGVDDVTLTKAEPVASPQQDPAAPQPETPAESATDSP